jgi:hypothetical protein
MWGGGKCFQQLKMEIGLGIKKTLEKYKRTGNALLPLPPPPSAIR